MVCIVYDVDPREKVRSSVVVSTLGRKGFTPRTILDLRPRKCTGSDGSGLCVCECVYM